MALREKLQSAERALSSPDSFRIPPALMNAGVAAWLFVGAVAALLIMAAFVMISASISIPLILAAVIGAIAYPLAERLRARGWSATVSALTVLVGLLAVITLTSWIAIEGIISQWPSFVAGAQAGVDKLVATLESYGWNAESIRAAIEQVLKSGEADSAASSGALSNVVSSVASGLSGVFGFFFGVFIAVTLLYYILHDFNEITEWLASHIGLPADLGAGVVEDGVMSMRGYFRGTTLTGVCVALVITASAWLLGVPLAVTIGLVTFVTCYIPYFGAIFSGAFAFLIALGAGGLPVAVAMLVIVLVAQNVLQTVVSARFMGESLSLHPIVVLVVTMLGGTLGGLLLAALAAPLTAMGVRVTKRMKLYREAPRMQTAEVEPEAVSG